MKARLPKGYGRPDPQAMMRQVQKMQDEIRAKQDELANYLYQKETITGDEFMEILNREG